MPPGICTMESSESMPCSAPLPTGTPSTGKCVMLATMPGKCAAPPAPAMMTATPRPAAASAYSTRRLGVRWAETIFASCGTANSTSTSWARIITSQSDWLPMMMLTIGGTVALQSR